MADTSHHMTSAPLPTPTLDAKQEAIPITGHYHNERVFVLFCCFLSEYTEKNIVRMKHQLLKNRFSFSFRLG